LASESDESASERVRARLDLYFAVRFLGSMPDRFIDGIVGAEGLSLEEFQRELGEDTWGVVLGFQS
jgi:hypothetical protein